jgi:hypothetical protein
MTRPNPFVTSTSQLIGPDTLQKLNDQLRALDSAEREATLLQQAGVDQAGNLKSINDARDSILRFKSVYFPGQ